MVLLSMDFYPRPPRGGRQKPARCRTSRHPISIHALREEGDPRQRGCGRRPPISIHALREEGDLTTINYPKIIRKFLSTPSARRATFLACFLVLIFVIISIHALREEGDLHAPDGQHPLCPYFYPRPPRGGRPVASRLFESQQKFLSTPSARRATAKTETKSLFSYKLYNILHEFRRALIYNGSKNDPNHAKRHKNPVRRCRKNAENSPFAPGRETQNNSRPSCSKGG